MWRCNVTTKATGVESLSMVRFAPTNESGPSPPTPRFHQSNPMEILVAPRLRQGDKTSATVVKTRKAKGAGGAKRSSKPTNRLKPPEHAKPARGGKAKAVAEAAFKPATAAAPAPTAAKPVAVPAAPQPSEADVRRAQQDRLIALHHRLKPLEVKRRAAAEVVSSLKADEKAIRAQ